MSKKVLVYLIFSLALIFALYFVLNNSINSQNFASIKNSLSENQKKLIKKYIFPYGYINQLESQREEYLNIIERNQVTLESFLPITINTEFEKKANLEDIEFFASKDDADLLYNDLTLRSYIGNNDLLVGIYNIYPGSGFIEVNKDQIFIVSSTGIIGKGKINDKKIIFKQLKSNITNFLPKDQFLDSRKLSVKGFKLIEDKIIISFIEEISEDCWNTSLIISEIDSYQLDFTKLFSSEDCINRSNNIDNEFEAWQAGGEIAKFNNNEILFSIGDFRSRYLAQNENSFNGKILKINIQTEEVDIISMGHRNPQGLFYDPEGNIILETEHGPQGGDEINLIEMKSEKLPNYGWAIASYGEHYGGKKHFNDKKYEKYPLYKSHKDNGFIEPLKYFVPSIGIGRIIGLGNRKYVVASLKDKSIYFFDLNTANKITNLNRVHIGERIRDITFSDNKIFIFMETTASIGIINL